MAFVCIMPNVNDLLLTTISKTCRICEPNNWYASQCELFCMSIFTGRQRSCGKQWFQSCHFALRGGPGGSHVAITHDALNFSTEGPRPLYRAQALPPNTHNARPPPPRVQGAGHVQTCSNWYSLYRNPSPQTHVQICSFWSTYGRQVGSWHPAGILSCWHCKSLPWPKVIKWATWKSTRTSGKITMHLAQVFNLL